MSINLKLSLLAFHVYGIVDNFNTSWCINTKKENIFKLISNRF